jgi:hypothetical protein
MAIAANSTTLLAFASLQLFIIIQQPYFSVDALLYAASTNVLVVFWEAESKQPALLR